jgi:hypothetical protein
MKSSLQMLLMHNFIIQQSSIRHIYLLHAAQSFLISSDSQEIPRILWIPMVHYHTHECLPTVPLLNFSVNNSCIYGEVLWTHCPTPKLEDHPLSAVRGGLFNIFTAALHIAGCSSIFNLRMHCDV